MVLTYLSIMTSDVPILIKEAADAAAVKDAAKKEAATEAPGIAAAPKAEQDEQAQEAAPATTAPAPASPPSAAGVLLALLLVFAVALACRFLTGARQFDRAGSSSASRFIEAWKLNRGVPMSGPFRLAADCPFRRPRPSRRGCHRRLRRREADRPTPAAVRICAGCGGELAPSFLACPRCGRLVHAETLKGLASEGESAEHAADHSRALAAWRQVLALLPAGSGQHTRVQEKVQALSAMVSPASPFGGGGTTAGPAATAAGGAARSGWKKWAAGAGALGVVLLKFKWVLLFLLTKAKVLLARADAGEDIPVDGARARRLHDDLRMAVRARPRRLDLHSRDGPRRLAAPLRDSGDGADVHPRRRRIRPLEGASRHRR